MITLNQLISLYQDIGSRHKQVNDFMAVQDFNIEMDRAPTYPLLVVNPVSANMPKSEGGYTVFNTTLELQVLDLVNKDNNNRMDVMSDTQQIIADIVTEFSTHPYYIDNSIDTVSDISFDPIRGAYGGDVDGWKISVTLEHPVKLSYCGNPVENIQGFDFSAPTKVTVTDNENPSSPIELYGGDTYTCIVTDPKAGIQYQRPQPTAQLTSYRTGDDAWRVANMPYSDAPANPLYAQELVDFFTLKHDNAFGNRLRFTDINGLQTITSDPTGQPDASYRYIVDNLTGLGMAYQSTYVGSNKSWNDAVDECLSLSAYGFDDYYLPNIPEIDSFMANDGNLYNKLLWWAGGSRTQWTSTTVRNVSTSARTKQIEGVQSYKPKTQTNGNYIPIRQHF